MMLQYAVQVCIQLQHLIFKARRTNFRGSHRQTSKLQDSLKKRVKYNSIELRIKRICRCVNSVNFCSFGNYDNHKTLFCHDYVTGYLKISYYTDANVAAIKSLLYWFYYGQLKYIANYIRPTNLVAPRNARMYIQTNEITNFAVISTPLALTISY